MCVSSSFRTRSEYVITRKEYVRHPRRGCQASRRSRGHLLDRGGGGGIRYSLYGWIHAWILGVDHRFHVDHRRGRHRSIVTRRRPAPISSAACYRVPLHRRCRGVLAALVSLPKLRGPLRIPPVSLVPLRTSGLFDIVRVRPVSNQGAGFRLKPFAIQDRPSFFLARLTMSSFFVLY